MKRKKFISIGVVATILLLVLFWRPMSGDTSRDIFVSVQRGNFESLVYTTGQLQAENSEQINVPSTLSRRGLGIYEIKVTKIVDEGTRVDSGDFVASLDHSAVLEQVTKADENLEKTYQSLEDAKMDTSTNLTNLRDGLISTRETVEEKQLVVDQSIYESPSVQRQVKIEFQKAQRKLEQDQRTYKLKEVQAGMKVGRALDEVRKSRERISDLNDLYESLEIKAPKPGMVIYSFDRFGKKMKVGSTVSRWMPTIAELPDLSSMISTTFINEIDISRISKGQKVSLGVDAFPEKHFSGEVIRVANMGQTLPGGDTKVFEVVVKIDGADKDLKPGMTTSNAINTAQYTDTLYIPLEAVFHNDSLFFVYPSDDSGVRQIVDLGEENENFALVREGLEEGVELFLNEPEGGERFEWKGLEIYEGQKERLRQEAQAKKKQKDSKGDLSPEEQAIVKKLKERGLPQEKINSILEKRRQGGKR